MKKTNCIIQIWNNFWAKSLLWKIFFIIFCVFVFKLTLPISNAFIILNFLETPMLITKAVLIALLASYIMYFLAKRRIMSHVDYSKWVLVFAFLWGAGCIAFNSFLREWLFLPQAWEAIRETPAFGGFVEEIAKAIFLFGLAIVGPQYFKNILSGILAGWFVGMGFSFLENASYFTGFLKDKIYVAVIIRFVQGILTGGHLLYSGLVGGGIAYVLNRYKPISLLWFSPLILLPSVLIHMLHNGLLGAIFILVSFVIGVTVFIWFLTKGIKWCQKIDSENR